MVAHRTSQTRRGFQRPRQRQSVRASLRRRRRALALVPLVVLAVAWTGSAGGQGIIDPKADLALSKSAPSSVANGSGFSYTLVVVNNGPFPAVGVVLTDNLPPNVVFASASSSQGGCSGGGSTVSCSLGSINVKGSVSVSIAVTAKSNGVATNTASVSGNPPDPNTGNNSASASTEIAGGFDLSIAGTVTPENVSPGADQTYRFVVTNAGPDNAPGTQVALTVPDRATFVSVTPSQGSCVGNTTVQCALGTIGSGGSATVALVLRSSTSGDLPVQGTVTSNSPETNPGNNAITVTGRVVEAFDLRVTMTSKPAKVGKGEWITYAITARNLGPGAANGVKVADQLPETVAFVSCATTQGECTSTALLKVAAGPTVDANIGHLAAGASARITILGRATAPGPAVNSVVVSGLGESPSLLGNNQLTARTAVVRKQFEPPADVPPPVFKKSVDAALVTGTVKFRRPGSNVFEILADGVQLPLGTEFDTTTGTMLLTSATDAQGAVQTAEFWDGFFVVKQTTVETRKTFTDLTLTRGDFSVCRNPRKLAANGAKPPRKKKSTTTRKLWGKGQGQFRTKGKYSSAAIRGTQWLTADRCDGTLTSVREGVVAVNDFGLRRTIVVRAGQSYLARPKR